MEVVKGRLCLSRKESEVIMIGDDVSIKIDRVQGKQVHISIVAPLCLSIHRKEIYDKIQEDKGV